LFSFVAVIYPDCAGSLRCAVAVLEAADVIITVAGADPPLPGILINLLDAPVIAVPVTPPTISSSGGSNSMGSLQAMGTLLTTLSSSSPGVAVVDIDSPVGAATVAARMLRATAARVNKLMAMSSLAAVVPSSTEGEEGSDGAAAGNGAAVAAAAAAAAEGFNVGAGVGAWPMPLLSLDEDGDGKSSSNGAMNGAGTAYAAVTR
jgi:phosphoribosylcarboxyaminoimidazole (NCAIR) mutase